MIELGALHFSAAQLGAGEFLPFLGIPDHRRFDLVTMFSDQVGEAKFKGPCAQDLEDFIGVAEIGFAILDLATHLFKGPALTVNHRRHLWIDGEATQVTAPGNARALKIATKRPRKERTRFAVRNRRARIRAGQRLQEQGHILHRARHRPFH